MTLLYPIAGNIWNSRIQARCIDEYASTEEDLTSDARNEVIERAQLFNENLAQIGGSIFDLANLEDTAGGTDALDVAGDGIIGYVTISKISVEVPIYRSDADKNVLQSASLHLAGTSLPIGGQNTHCVIYAHRGLASAQLFSDLDLLAVGDTFQISILDETHTYEVDQILVVEPNDDSALRIAEGQDFCTLLTCTPYGINTHRLLVRGKRIQSDLIDEPLNADFFSILVFTLTVITTGGVVLAVMWKKHRQKQKRRTLWKKGLLR